MGLGTAGRVAACPEGLSCGRRLGEVWRRSTERVCAMNARLPRAAATLLTDGSWTRKARAMGSRWGCHTDALCEEARAGRLLCFQA